MTIQREVLESITTLDESTNPGTNWVIEVQDPAENVPVKVQLANIDVSGVATTPGGADTNVQVNQGGSFAGYSTFTYDDSTSQLTLTSTAQSVATLSVSSTDTTANAMVDFHVNQSASPAVALLARHADTTKTALSISGGLLAQHSAVVQGVLQVDTINEFNTAAGVTVEDVTLRAGQVDGYDVAILGAKVATVESGADVTDTTNVDAAGAVMNTDFSADGVLCRTASETYTARTITGTANQITITNGDGVSGDPTIALTDDPIMGGTGGFVPPAGTTAQRVTTTGIVRYNSTLNVWEGFDGTSWVDFTTGGGATPGGADTQLQFNDGGAFEGDAELTWNTSTKELALKGNIDFIDTTDIIRITTDPDAEPTTTYYDDSGAAARIVITVNDTTDAGSIVVNDASANSTFILGASVTTPNLKSNVIDESTAGTGVTVDGVLIKDGEVDGRDVSVDGTKLDGVESGATADQTGAEIKAAYEAEADTNAFTDADKTKLDGIEAGAEVNPVVNPASVDVVAPTSSADYAIPATQEKTVIQPSEGTDIDTVTLPTASAVKALGSERFVYVVENASHQAVIVQGATGGLPKVAGHKFEGLGHIVAPATLGRFDNTNQKLTISVWFEYNAQSAQRMVRINDADGDTLFDLFLRNSDGTFACNVYNDADPPVELTTSSDPRTAALTPNTLQHAMLSFDFGASLFTAALDGSTAGANGGVDSTGQPGLANAAEVVVGAINTSGSQTWDGQVLGLGIWQQYTTDPTLFRNSDGTPVDLGQYGELPFPGTYPFLFFNRLATATNGLINLGFKGGSPSLERTFVVGESYVATDSDLAPSGNDGRERIDGVGESVTLAAGGVATFMLHTHLGEDVWLMQPRP